MNTRTDTPIRISEEAQPQVRQPQRRKPNPKVLHFLCLGMLVSGAVIVVLVLTMLLLPMLKINKIVVEGNTYYDDETVAQMAGIATGDELLGWNMQDSCDALMEAYPYAKDILQKGDAVLVKASNGMAFKEIVASLQQLEL